MEENTFEYWLDIEHEGYFAADQFGDALFCWSKERKRLQADADRRRELLERISIVIVDNCFIKPDSADISVQLEIVLATLAKELE